jgi:hypothetical protein
MGEPAPAQAGDAHATTTACSRVSRGTHGPHTGRQRNGDSVAVISTILMGPGEVLVLIIITAVVVFVIMRRRKVK